MVDKKASSEFCLLQSLDHCREHKYYVNFGLLCDHIFSNDCDSYLNVLVLMTSLCSKKLFHRYLSKLNVSQIEKMLSIFSKLNCLVVVSLALNYLTSFRVFSIRVFKMKVDY